MGSSQRSAVLPPNPDNPARTRSNLAAMGFLKQDTPQIDFEEWNKGTRAEKIIPMARHWAEVGFGTPVVLHLFYVVKILLYIVAAWLVALTTTGTGGLSG